METIIHIMKGKHTEKKEQGCARAGASGWVDDQGSYLVGWEVAVSGFTTFIRGQILHHTFCVQNGKTESTPLFGILRFLDQISGKVQLIAKTFQNLYKFLFRGNIFFFKKINNTKPCYKKIGKYNGHQKNKNTSKTENWLIWKESL